MTFLLFPYSTKIHFDDSLGPYPLSFAQLFLLAHTWATMWPGVVVSVCVCVYHGGGSWAGWRLWGAACCHRRVSAWHSRFQQSPTWKGPSLWRPLSGRRFPQKGKRRNTVQRGNDDMFEFKWQERQASVVNLYSLTWTLEIDMSWPGFCLGLKDTIMKGQRKQVEGKIFISTYASLHVITNLFSKHAGLTKQSSI